MPDNDLQKLSPAYRLPASDPDFILSDSMQGVRFLLEFAKADERLRSWGVRTTIVVFGSARIREANGDARGAPAAASMARWYDEARRFGRIVNITSSSVKAPIDVLGLSNGARSGLTGFVAGLARKTVAHNVTINNLLPGTFDTDRLKSNLQALATNTKRPVEEVTQDIRSSNPSRRFGRTEEFGATCAFLCSAQAGYITGQNILIDGGSYPGTF